MRTSSHIKVSVTAIKSILESAEKNIAPPLRAEDFEAIDSAILKLAISMDKSHRQKFRNITVELKDNKLIITGRTLYDVTLEQGIFKKCSDFFEEVYGIQPVLKQKKQF